MTPVANHAAPCLARESRPPGTSRAFLMRAMIERTATVATTNERANTSQDVAARAGETPPARATGTPHEDSPMAATISPPAECSRRDQMSGTSRQANAMGTSSDRRAVGLVRPKDHNPAATTMAAQAASQATASRRRSLDARAPRWPSSVSTAS